MLLDRSCRSIPPHALQSKDFDLKGIKDLDQNLLFIFLIVIRRVTCADVATKSVGASLPGPQWRPFNDHKIINYCQTYKKRVLINAIL